MKNWENDLPPRVRERLAAIGEATAKERQEMRDTEELNSLLREFFKGSLDSKALWEVLKEHEAQGKQFLLKEAREKLKPSIQERRLSIRFEETNDGTLTVEFVEKEEEQEEALLVLELMDNNFDEAVQKYPVLVVDCWAPWCGPCKMVAPIIEELARDHQGKITFGKLNVDDNTAVATRYRVMSIPTLLIFKNGQLVDEKVGAIPRHLLEPELIKHI